MGKGSTRSCQPCTACCDGWLAISINNYDVRPGRPCLYSTGAGCSDYKNRPVDPCRTFQCGWRMEGSPLPEWMKPNLSKVIVVLDKLTNGQPVIMAAPVGVSIPARSLDWLKQFADQHNAPLVYTEQILQDGRYSTEQGFIVHAPSSKKDEVIKWLQSSKMRSSLGLDRK